MLHLIKKIFIKTITFAFPEIKVLKQNTDWNILKNAIDSSVIKSNVCLFSPYKIYNCNIDKYSYISYNSNISFTNIGKFCSIGPNLVCGWGIHPTNGISTSPSFYSTKSPNNVSFSTENKIVERKPITIGNDVFIGANVTIMDGVTIGDGAIIGAGAVVSKDIPPYAIAVGCPIEIMRYRFNEEKIDALKKIEWWNFDEDQLKDVEKYFFNIDAFIEKYTTNV